MRCWLLHVGTKCNRIENLACRLERTKAEGAVCVTGWVPKWQDLSNVMRQWETQIQSKAQKFPHFDPEGEVNEGIEDAIETVERIELELKQ